ncbi:phage GP46 family protein [Vibrio spartinae]|uniref:Phage protein GP46 n=1 Tax=Vibrio spartinae TaxID=1918945 RepID=A0A1N6M5R2_9VIBR|nr:phage GP46 family protein [Vibrio spartinae]SIO94783.1 Phage protein GP46 [Vibrio spartinae]
MINIVWKENGYDYDVVGGVLKQGDNLKTMVIYCLFTDAKATESDELPQGTTDKRGWPGDTFSEFNWGSRLWLLKRKKLTNQIVLRVQDYAKEALTPLISRYIKSAKVNARRSGRDTVDLSIVLIKPNDDQLTLEAQLKWEAIRV